MKKIILPLVVVLVFGISIYTVVDYNKSKSKDIEITAKSTEPNSSTAAIKEPTNGNPSPTVKSPGADKIAALDFKLNDINGKEISLSDFKGKKVFLNFWASWCPPCKAEMPDIEKLYGQTKDSDLVILAVNIGEGNATAKSFIDDNKYNFTVLLDSNQSVARQYSIVAIPTSFFIDKEGNIVSTIKGGMTLQQMKDNINKL